MTTQEKVDFLFNALHDFCISPDGRINPKLQTYTAIYDDLSKSIKDSEVNIGRNYWNVCAEDMLDENNSEPLLKEEFSAIQDKIGEESMNNIKEYIAHNLMNSDHVWEEITENVKKSVEDYYNNSPIKDASGNILNAKDEYREKTYQELEIIQSYVYFRHNESRLIVVCPTKNNDGFTWGWDYSLVKGNWNQGHYNFATKDDCVEDLKNNYPDARLIDLKTYCKADIRLK